MTKISTLFEGLFGLLFPNLCVGCDRLLNQAEKLTCTHCQYHLPVTNFHLDDENPAAKQLWGRVKLQHVFSYLYYTKDSTVQRMLYHLKYFSNPKIGYEIGRQYGAILAETDHLLNVDLIVPVPLHPRKLKERGYNQSEYFAKGLSEAMNIRFLSDALVRDTSTVSQTKKNRYERYQNMESIFQLKGTDILKAKHVLLVDDVLTTGATIEACANALLEVPYLQISVATIAYTK